MAVSREHPPSQPALDRDERVAGAEHSYQHALETFRDLGHRPGQAEALNHLGELSSCTSASHQAGRARASIPVRA